MNEDGFALPAFEPAAALVQLQRSLRELRGLSARGSGFDLKGQAVIELSAEADAITARLARRPARSPEWDRFDLTGSTELRRFIDEAKKRVARWTDDER